MGVRRAAVLEAGPGGVVGRYVHSASTPSAGSTVSLVSLRCDVDAGVSTDDMNSLAKQIAMHVAAGKPRFLNRGAVPEDVIKAERAVLSAGAASSGKPPAVID